MTAGLVLSGRYQLVAQLGAGGFGSVWQGRDLRLERDVAVKLLHVANTDMPRFEREARALAQVDHPAVVTAYDYGVDVARAYLILELIRGRSLADELLAAAPRGGGLPVPRVLAIADQVLDGLAAAHAAGFVHRDLKPQNVMTVGDGPRIKIVDFGIAHAVDMARMTSTGIVVGTLQYMAPEQIDGAPLDGRADLYSLGCMLFELISGGSAFEATSPVSWMKAHTLTPPAWLRDRVPGVPPEVDAFVHRLLAKDPAGRPAGAAECRAELARIMSPANRPAALVGAAPTVVDGPGRHGLYDVTDGPAPPGAPVYHHPRLAWDGARTIVEIAGSGPDPVAEWLVAELTARCGAALGAEVRATRSRLRHEGPDARAVEAGRWRARLQGTLDDNPHLAPDFHDLISAMRDRTR